MSFFIQKSEDSALSHLTDSDTYMKLAPDYYAPRFDAIAEMRALDDGSLHKGNEFRRVASLTNVPMLAALKILEPDFLSNRKKFYKWLDSGNNWRYCTYDRRKNKLPNQLTFVDGKAVT